MLRTMNFRTKLLGILVVPLIGLLALTAFAVSDKRAEADSSARARDRIGVVGAAEALAQQVRLEEGLSGKEVATGNRKVAIEQRAATDTTIAALHSALASSGDAGSNAYDVAVSRLDTNLKALTTYRSSVDFGTDASFFLTGYENVLTNISNLVSTIADETDDPQLSRQVAALAALSRGQDAIAGEWAVLQVSFTRGVMAITESSELKATVTDRERWLAVYEGLAASDSLDDVRNQIASEDAQRAESFERNALAAADDPKVTLTGNAGVWEASMRAQLTGLSAAAARQIAGIDAQAVRTHNDAVDALRRFLLLTTGVIAVSVGLALLVARAVTRPLGKLTAAAQNLADVQLPGLVSGLRSPGADDQGYLVAAIRPIEIRSQDEIGMLADAFNTVQAVAVDVAAEQADLLRKGIGDIFVNLARRNQVLIDRQIEFLDELEAAENDPDQLGQLYRLDHLATRMRRNAESLLVLAGLESTRKRTKPVPLVDVVRAAIGEVEEYVRVEIAAFDDVEIVGNAAVDLGHLLAELLENATNFSPPTSRVEVQGSVKENGYVLTIVDEGIGMSDEQLADANALLAKPAPVGLALTRSLGFTVVGRLAARFGVGVRLTAAASGGVSAIVSLPEPLLVPDDAASEPAPTPDADEAFVAPPALKLVSSQPVAASHQEWEPEWPDGVSADHDAHETHDADQIEDADEVHEPLVVAVPTAIGGALDAAVPTLDQALPQGAQFERGVADLLRGDDALGAARWIEPPLDQPSTITHSGLAKRLPSRDVVDDAGVIDDRDPRPPIAAGRRSPDDVRAMLARYRSGLQRGRTPDEHTDEEETS